MKIIAIVVIALVLMIPMSSAFASWHWSSPYKVCGEDVIKKTEECHMDSDKSVVSQMIPQVQSDQMICKEGLNEIIKKSTKTYTLAETKSTPNPRVNTPLITRRTL